MADVGLKDLLQAGVHFGHQTHRWNPKMRKYIFADRGGIYLIDLKKTLRELIRAGELVRETVLAGQSVLFVCTKPQLAEIVRSEAERCGAFYVTERWLGGMLTNFQTIRKNIRRLKDLERGTSEGIFEFYTKKERLLLQRERQKLERYLSGIKEMTRLPGLVYVVDAKKEEIAVREANRLEIPVVAIADTNADPDLLSVPIAGNDDAIRSVSLITRTIADEIETAKREAPQARIDEEDEVFTYSSDVGETEEAPAKRRKKRARPRRRPKPELIARRRHSTEEGERSEAGEEEGERSEEGEEPSATSSGENAEDAGKAEPRGSPAEVVPGVESAEGEAEVAQSAEDEAEVAPGVESAEDEAEAAAGVEAVEADRKDDGSGGS
ncbi:MAG: 30S ribosomal protein S2 [Gemmatimonadota bacterium]